LYVTVQIETNANDASRRNPPAVSSLKVIFVAKNMDNTLCCPYGEDAGCRFLDTGYLKVIIFFYPASSIQYLPTVK
jgi:hypothetical protein